MLIAQRPTLSEETVDEFRSRFVIEPLEPGFGYTLGNSLRRTLLSSIPGASVTSIRIDSVLHEFSTIEGVKEDVTEIILNLKGLVVSSEHDEPVTMYLRKSGAGDVTAADIAFYGTMDGWFKAVDAKTGELLWRFKTGSGIVGQPITYRGPDGRQYVAVLAGVGGWSGAVVAGDLDTRDATAALGFVNAMTDLPQATAKGGSLYIFGLP